MARVMLLSILICTLPERSYQFNRLMGILLPQSVGKDMEILIDDRPRQVPTGQKRNDLIAKANGDYIAFVDDDDTVTDDYIFWLLSGIAKNPDVITFCGYMTTDGGSKVNWIIKLGEKYEARKDRDQITRYYRFPNHLTAMKKPLIAHVKFAHVWQGEDYQWALKIHNAGLLKTEVHIDRQLYHYAFITHK